MGFNPSKYRVRLVLAGLALFAVAAPAAQAQSSCCFWQRREVCPPDTFAPPTDPKVDPKTTTVPSVPAFTTAALSSDLGSFSPGYLDNALPMSQFRLRFDAAYRNNRPDRAEYFYGKCGCFPGGPGPVQSETSVDYQDISGYLEVAPSQIFSVFAEFPLRMLNPDVNPNTSGLADINAGFKVVLIGDERRVLTFQGRIFIPTGDPDRGLGTDHVSLEPSLLYADNLSDRLVFFAQFGDWIPVGGTDFQGNILRYGAGVSYTVVDNGSFRVAPIVELLGWSVLGGQELTDRGTKDASGDTILNGKLGARIGFGGNSDLYIGYGRALTGEVWYKDIVRVEYRLRF